MLNRTSATASLLLLGKGDARHARGPSARSRFPPSLEISKDDVVRVPGDPKPRSYNDAEGTVHVPEACGARSAAPVCPVAHGFETDDTTGRSDTTGS